MPVVTIPDWDKYCDAIATLIEVGGTFHSRPTQRLIVTAAQYQALLDKGIVTPAENGNHTSGKVKKKKSTKS